MGNEAKEAAAALAMMVAVGSIAALKEPISALAIIHQERMLDAAPVDDGDKSLAAIKAIASAAFVLAEVVDEQRAALGIKASPILTKENRS